MHDSFSKPARKELERAHRAVSKMRAAQSLDDIEEAWRQFLQDINRVWTKIAVLCQADFRRQQWLKPHLNRRKTDMLLRYLHHARNSDEHTLTQISTQNPGGFGIKSPSDGGSVYIKSLHITQGAEGTEIDYEGSAVVFEFVAPHVKLQRVYDRGKWYNPPTQHLGIMLTAADPIAVAELSLTYCGKMLDEADALP